MAIVNVGEAKTRLSELLALVEKGEDVVLARAGKPVARLVRIDPRPRRELGATAYHVPDTFFEPLPEEELSAWQ